MNQNHDTVGNTTTLPMPIKKFIPTANLLALHVHPGKESDSGLVMPDGTQTPDQSPLSTVIAAGPECKWIKEGDVVITNHNLMIVHVWHQGMRYTIAEESQITGVIIPE